MAVGAVVARIITQYSDKGSKQAQKDIRNLGRSFDEFSKRTVRAFAVATAAVGAFAVKVGKDAVQAAMADQKSQVLLANSLRNTTGATNAAIASVESYISKLQLQVGVADDDLRPALSRLAAVTGSVTAAQDLLGTALDVSAFAGVDLDTATNALTRALLGNFRGLQRLVPSIDATAIKSKNLAAVFADVNEATAGSAAARANTLEFRLAILRIRYSEILETLGYQLLPVIERFASIIQTKVLPQLQAWVDQNGTKLVSALQFAADATLKLLGVSIAFSNWIVNNMGLVKTMAALIAGMFIVGKVAAFIGAIKTLAGAFVALRTAAAGAAIATAFATGGTSVIAATAALAAVGGAAAIYSGLKSAGDKVRSRKTGPLGNYAMSTGSQSTPTSKTAVAGMTDFSSLQKSLTAQNKLNNAKKKQLTLEQKIINAMLRKYGLSLMTAETEARATATAIKLNLDRQAGSANAVAASPTVSLAAQGDGSSGGAGTIAGSSGRNLIEVKVELPLGYEQEYVTKVSDGSRILNRRGGGGGGGLAVAQVK